MYGDPSKLEAGQLLDYIVQRHKARRAGEHYDVRFGTPETGLFSWASRKGIPAPGQKHLAIQQPLHEHGYKDFEGEIPSGYGAGSVSKHDEGQILVTKVLPNAVHFTTAHRRYPERFVLTRGVGKKWLLINSTKTEAVPYAKVHYASVPAERAEEILGGLKPGSSAQAKIDGAASLTKLFKDHAEVVSYRAAKGTGHPIVHTERVFGGRPETRIPASLVGSVLRGELYGTGQGGRATPPQQLGGILNSSIAKSLGTQKEKGISLKNMLFDVQQLGNKPVAPGTPYAERMKMLQQVLPHLGEKFHGPEEAKTPEDALSLWKRISSGKHPLTHEGVVVHPPTGKPTKLKLREEHDVHIRDFFPGMGKLQGKGVGGFRYSHTPTGPIAGEVGTGFSDQLRQEMHQMPQDFVGRVARVLAQEKLPSGALRAPALIGLHEDMPTAKVGSHAEDTSMFRYQGIQSLAEHAQPLSEPHLRQVPLLRGSWHTILRKLAEFVRSIPSRHGPLSAGSDSGKKEHEWTLRAEQLHLGHTKSSTSQHEQKCASDFREQNAVHNSMGRGERDQCQDNSFKTGTGLERGEISYDSGSDRTQSVLHSDSFSSTPGSSLEEKTARIALEDFLGIPVTEVKDPPYTSDGTQSGTVQSQENAPNCHAVIKNATGGAPECSSFDCQVSDETPSSILAETPSIEPRNLEKLSIWTLESLAEKAAKVRIDDLLKAKAESDRRNYKAKHDILRRLIGSHPHEFKIDSKTNGIVGVTHVPSGFRVHLPRRVVPTKLL